MNNCSLRKAILSIVIVNSFCFTKNQDISAWKINWFISSASGIQISGIKSEDFVKSNIAPSITIGLGNWVTPKIGLHVGYKGPYFYYIGTEDRHYYNFIFGEVLVSMEELINFNNRRNKQKFILHLGGGFFYNNYYKRPNMAGNVGIINNIRLNRNYSLIIDVSGIIAWDIYQGNEDILPSCVIGVFYNY